MSLAKIRATVSNNVINDVCKAYKCTPEDLAGDSPKHRLPRAMLWRSMHLGGLTFSEIAEIVGRQVSTVYRVVQRAYPADYPGRGAKAA